MSARDISEPRSALSDALKSFDRSLRSIERGQTWPSPIIVSDNPVELRRDYPQPPSWMDGGNWPRDGVGAPSSSMLLPRGRWVVVSQATLSIYSNLVVTPRRTISINVRFAVNGVEVSTASAATKFVFSPITNTFRYAMSIDSDGSTVFSVHPYAGMLGGSPVNVIYEFIASKIVAYPG